MDFRWVVAITLWTLLAGPVFGPPVTPHDTASVRAHAVPPAAVGAATAVAPTAGH